MATSARASAMISGASVVTLLLRESAMWMRFSIVLIQSVVGVLSAPILSAGALAEDRCTGHELLSIPRSESSCLTVRPQIYPSPDAALRALVLPVDVDLHATPDMESRIVI